MSSMRPSSICDTTPLQQRAENQSQSSEEPSSPLSAGTASASTSSSSCISGSTASNSSNNNNNNNNNSNNANNNNQQHSHKIELHLPNFVEDGQMLQPRGFRCILRRIFVDFSILCCVGLPIIAFILWAEPHRRGFFCDDESLRFPYRESTIRGWMLYLICVLLPIAVITIVEFYKPYNGGNGTKLNSVTTSLKTTKKKKKKHRGYGLCHGLALPDWLSEAYSKIGALIFGCGAAQLTTEIGKYSIGRLRPHFFEVCEPLLADGSTCSDPLNAHRYVEKFTCLGTHATAKMLRDVRLSFPSGHACFTWYAMVYLAIYLQKRTDWRHGKLLRHLLQFLLLLFAWYTTLTRVSDYKHHWTDVVAGSAIGISYAFIVTKSLW